MMGSGKSTIGRLLADGTGWPYVDNDELVARLHGATSRQLLATVGEERMRRAELDALEAGLATPAPCIVGAAAGTILDHGARARLHEAGTVVWLRTSARALEERATAGAHRPWVDTHGDAWIERETRTRERLYASVADIVVDTDVGPPATSTTQILDALRQTTRCVEELGKS